MVQNKKIKNPMFILIGIMLLLSLMIYGSYRHKQELTHNNQTADESKVQPKVKNDQPEVRTPSAMDIRAEKQYQAEKALRAFLKDPDSADIKNQNGFCGEVNSKNGFGGYTGYKRFMASPALVVIEGENMSDDEFNKAWSEICK